MVKDCESCVYNSNLELPECGICVVSYLNGVQQGKPSNYKEKTIPNTDRIRAMSYEEFDEILTFGDTDLARWVDDIDKAIKAEMEWLKYSAEEGEGNI